MIDYALGQLVRLVNIPSPTGFTRAATDYLLEELTRLGYAPRRSVKGTVFCELGGQDRPLLLSAHVDTLGAMVRSIKSSGRLRYTHVGGYADSTVETENCLVHAFDGRVYSGTVQSTEASQHVFGEMNKKERSEETLEIVLDEEVKSAADVRALGIDTGCYISWDPRCTVTASGYIKSRHLDDKASASVLLDLARAVKEGEVRLARNTWILFSVYEEVGHGASSLPGVPFEEMLAVDMGCVGDDLACDETMVSICCKDSHGPYNYEMTRRLAALAKENGLSYAVDVYPRYGSDAGAALTAGLEARHALIGPGVFASHGYERTHKKGLENTCRLVRLYAEQA